MSIKNSVSSKTIRQSWRKHKACPEEAKLSESSTNGPALREMLKAALLSRKEGTLDRLAAPHKETQNVKLVTNTKKVCITELFGL